MNDTPVINSKKRKLSVSPEKTNEERQDFLNSKNIFEDQPELQKIKFKYILNPETSPKNLQIHYEKCRDRLDRILSRSGDKVVLREETFPSDVQSFQDFLTKVSEWDSEDSFVFHKHHKAVKGKQDILVQRLQLSGLCYIHGPDLLQHYLVSMTTSEAIGMVDISKLVREAFDKEQLEKHIFEDKGGDSRSMLEYILMNDSIVISTGDIRNNLEAFGPGLVSFFKVHKDFTDKTIHSHVGVPVGELVGLHAMVLIGHRVGIDGKVFYLLQNWWKDKQFVEVDQEYFKRCNPTVYFVETPQTEIPSRFQTCCPCQYAESENLDKEEKYSALEY